MAKLSRRLQRPVCEAREKESLGPLLLALSPWNACYVCHRACPVVEAKSRNPYPVNPDDTQPELVSSLGFVCSKTPGRLPSCTVSDPCAPSNLTQSDARRKPPSQGIDAELIDAVFGTNKPDGLLEKVLDLRV